MSNSDLLAAAIELLAVAEFRQDNVLPRPEDDPKPCSARMQEAWDNLEVIPG